MSGKLHLICMKTEGFHAKIRCNLNDISYLSETQKNNFQFLLLYLLLYSFLFSIYNYVFLKKIRFQLIVRFAHLTMTCVCRRYDHDVQKIKMAAALQLKINNYILETRISF